MIKRFLKKLFITATCLFLSLMCGCADNSVSDSGEEVQLYDTGNITVYRFDGGTVGIPGYDDDWYNQFLEYYHEQFGGTVTAVVVEWQDWEKRYNIDLASGIAPDLVYLFEKNFYQMLDRNLLVSVEQMIENNIVGTDHPSLILKQRLANDLYSANGKTYAFACAYAEADMIFVNEDLFKKYSVTSPYEYYTAGKWDMANFMTCLSLITRDTDSDGNNDIFGYYGYEPYAFVASAGGEFIHLDDEGNLVSDLNDPQTLQGISNYRSVYTSGYATEQYSSWLRGQTAMVGWVPQSEYYNLVGDRIDFNWSVVPFPLDATNTSSVRSGKCYGWAISATSVNWQGCVNYVVALNKYSVINPNAVQPNYSLVFNTNQLEMFSDSSDNIRLPLFYSVGDLNATSQNIWRVLSDGKISDEEALSMLKKEIDGQIKN